MSLNLGLARRATDPTSFDLDTATNLYWADAPAIIHQPGRDQQKAELTVRILSGVDRHNPASRVRHRRTTAPRPLVEAFTIIALATRPLLS